MPGRLLDDFITCCRVELPLSPPLWVWVLINLCMKVLRTAESPVHVLALGSLSFWLEVTAGLFLEQISLIKGTTVVRIAESADSESC